MWSDNHSHQWESCRCPVIPAGEKEGNHLPLFFRALHPTGNRGNIRKLPEYGVVSHTQCLADVTERNGGASNLVPYETIVRATSGETEAVDEVLHELKRVRSSHLPCKRICSRGRE